METNIRDYVDVRALGIESVCTSQACAGGIPFHRAKIELEEAGYDIISLKQLADLRIVSEGLYAPENYHDSFTREGFLYVPEKGIFLVKNSPIMANAKEATQCHSKFREFYLTPEQTQGALGKEGIDSVQFRDTKPIPARRFGEDERTVFAFGDSAQKYGDFLEKAGITEIRVHLVDVKGTPFARPVRLGSLGSCGYGSDIDGNAYLHCGLNVRGVRNI
jgi:hypothetical protein